MTTSFENLNEPLAQLKKQLKSSRFLSWLLRELSDMVPAWMRSSGLTIDSYFLLPLEQVKASMGTLEAIGNRALAITLSDHHVLRKTLSLPLATEENLRQVLEFQMEQHTPFQVNQLYFGYAVKDRDFESKRLTVELVVTPRDPIDAAIKTLVDLGLDVRALFVDELLASGILLNLLPVALGNAPSVLRHGANPWLAGLVTVLAVGAMSAPPLIKRQAVVQLLPWVETGKKAAESVSAVRRELDLRVEQHNYLLEKRQASPAVIQIMEELTHILPDDTWIQVFDLKGKKLQIQGETASSAKLVGLFEHSSIFREASFPSSSATFKGQAPGTERYQLEIQLKTIAKAGLSSPTQARPPGVAASAPILSGAKAP